MYRIICFGSLLCGITICVTFSCNKFDRKFDTYMWEVHYETSGRKYVGESISMTYSQSDIGDSVFPCFCENFY